MRWVAQDDWWTLKGWPGVVARVTTRAHGIPAGAATASALRHVVEQGGGSPRAVIGLEQVHGGAVAVVTEAADRVLAGYDGAVTDQPSVTLTVRSADCLTILAYDPVRRAVGVAHAGWRGVKAAIPSRLVATLQQAFQSRPGDLQVAIGPAIGRCCYEVGPEFEPWFPGHVVRQAGGYRLNLAAAATAQLAGAGVPTPHIVPAPCCTACTPALCHSYRRDGASAGRLVAWLAIR